MKKVNLLLISFVTLVILSFGLSSCGSDSSSKPQSLSSIEEAKNYVAGKTFVASPIGGIWYKITFTGDSFTVWTGMPSYEGWYKSMSGNYTVSEDRYGDTGKKYYYVRLSEQAGGLYCWKFVLDSKMLHHCAGDAGVKMTEGDRDPWN